jgi:pilus assembly protein CpaC
VTLLLSSIMTQGWSAARAQEQTDGEPVPDLGFTATIKDMEGESTRVRVPLNGSVLVRTSHPVVTLQSVSPRIAVVQSISPTQFMISGASYGETQVIAWAKDGREQILFVTVEVDLQAMLDALREIDPRSDVRAVPIQGNIVLTGQVSSATAAQKMVEVAELFMPQGDEALGGIVQNYLQIAGEQQILLRCTVAEVNRRAVRKLGINGFLAGDNFQDVFVVNNLGGINPTQIGVPPGIEATATIPFVTGATTLTESTTLSLGFPQVQMQLFLQAMAENSLMRVLAEPNLVAVSGETATFLAGGEFPYPVPQMQDAITIEWREYGVRLNFTPVVLPNQTVRLRVAPEVSALDFTNAVQIRGTVVPGLNQRRSETTVEIGNGQTIAIAGLLNEEVRGVVTRVPGVGDVPVLGALFRSVEYQRNLTEMVVLVTPEIVAPLEPDQVPPVPGQLIRDPNDWELYFLGMVEGEPFADPSSPKDALQTHPAPRGTAYRSEPTQLSLHGPWGPSTAEDFR